LKVNFRTFFRQAGSFVQYRFSLFLPLIEELPSAVGYSIRIAISTGIPCVSVICFGEGNAGCNGIWFRCDPLLKKRYPLSPILLRCMAGGFRQTYIDVVQLPQPTWQPCFLPARRMANAIQVVKLLLLQQICNRLFVFLESLNIGVAVDVRFGNTTAMLLGLQRTAWRRCLTT
jgi:hypothetical protein